MNVFCNYFHDRIHDTYTYKSKSYKLVILIFNRYQSIYWHIDDPLSILFFPNNVNFSSNSEETATTCTERSKRSSHLPSYAFPVIYDTFADKFNRVNSIRHRG